MAGQEFHAIRCGHCGRYQVQQVKKNPQFKCTLCRKQQKLQEEHFRGPAKQCREIVQRLNKAQHDGEIGFTPSAAHSSEISTACSRVKRKPATTGEQNDTKRFREATSGKQKAPPKNTVSGCMSDDDEDLFPPETTSKSFETPKTLNIPKNEPCEEQREQSNDTGGKTGAVSESNTDKTEDDDDDDDIFNDVPSPLNPRPESPVQDHSPSPNAKPLSRSPERLKELFTDDSEFSGTVPEKEAKESGTDTSASGPKTVERNIIEKLSGEAESVGVDRTRNSPLETGNAEGTKITESWRRRSLDKLAKFKFDVDDDDAAERTSAGNNIVRIAAPKFREDGTKLEASVPQKNTDRCHTPPVRVEIPLESPHRPENPENVREKTSVSSDGGRGRFLATLQKFKRASKEKS